MFLVSRMNILKGDPSGAQQGLEECLQCLMWEHWLQVHCISLDAVAGISHPLSHCPPWLGHTP